MRVPVVLRTSPAAAAPATAAAAIAVAAARCSYSCSCNCSCSQSCRCSCRCSCRSSCSCGSTVVAGVPPCFHWRQWGIATGGTRSSDSEIIVPCPPVFRKVFATEYVVNLELETSWPDVFGLYFTTCLTAKNTGGDSPMGRGAGAARMCVYVCMCGPDPLSGSTERMRGSAERIRSADPASASGEPLSGSAERVR